MSETTQHTSPPAEGGESDWLPEAYRGNPAFQNFKGVEDLAKSYDHAHRFTGMDKATVLAIPKGEDADGWNKVYNQLGRPEKPADYGIQTTDADKAMWEEALPELHRMGMSKKQVEGVKAMLDGMSARYSEKMSDPSVAMETAMPAIGAVLASETFANRTDAALRQQWGPAFEDKMHAANKAAAALIDTGDAEIGKLFKAPQDGGYGLANLPGFIAMMAAIGDRLGEPGGLRGGGSGGQPPNLSPGQAATELARLSTDKEFGARMKAKDPEAIKQWEAVNAALRAG